MLIKQACVCCDLRNELGYSPWAGSCIHCQVMIANRPCQSNCVSLPWTCHSLHKESYQRMYCSNHHQITATMLALSIYLGDLASLVEILRLCGNVDYLFLLHACLTFVNPQAELFEKLLTVLFDFRLHKSSQKIRRLYAKRLLRQGICTTVKERLDTYLNCGQDVALLTTTYLYDEEITKGLVGRRTMCC
jgi:hypothetical protein